MGHRDPNVFDKDLEVALTEREIITKVKEQVRLKREVRTLLLTKKGIVDDYDDRIKAAQGRIRTLDEIIEKEREVRAVPHTYHHNFESMMVEEINMETGQIVDQRIMTARERQMSLPMDEPEQATTFEVEPARIATIKNLNTSGLPVRSNPITGEPIEDLIENDHDPEDLKADETHADENDAAFDQTDRQDSEMSDLPPLEADAAPAEQEDIESFRRVPESHEQLDSTDNPTSPRYTDSKVTNIKKGRPKRVKESEL